MTGPETDWEGERFVGRATVGSCPFDSQAAQQSHRVESMRTDEKLVSLSEPSDPDLDITRTHLSAQPANTLRTEVRFGGDTQPG